MKKEQFLKELEDLLQDISRQEREEALQYYRDYFDDAGPENEARIMEELGSPSMVARTIKAGLSGTEGEFTEQGFRDPRCENGQALKPWETEGQKGNGQKDSAGYQKQNGSRPAERKPVKRQKSNGWKIAFLVLLCLVFLPILLPVSIAVVAVLVSILVTVVAVALGIGAAALGLLIGGIAVVIFGIGKALVLPAAGLALAGTGLLLLALGILSVVVIVWCCVKFFPWLIRGIVKLLRTPFRKKEEVA